MRLYAGLFFLLISFDSLAQESHQRKFAVTLAPFEGFFDAGLDYQVCKRFSWFNEFGVEYIGLNVGQPDTMVVHPHGMDGRTELRYYIKRSRYITHYLAINVFFRNEAHNTEVDYVHHGIDTLLLKNDFGVRRKNWGCNVMYGWQWWTAGRFWVEFYAGAGVRFVDNHTVGERFNSATDYLIRPTDPSIAYLLQKSDVRAGYHLSPNLTANVRLVYRW